MQLLLFAWRTGRVFRNHAVLHPAAQHHHVPRTAPPGEPKLSFHRLKPRTDLAPVLAFPLPLHQAPDAGRLAQLEQIELIHLRHRRLVAKRVIPAHQRRALRQVQALQQPLQSQHTMLGRMRLAALNLLIQHQAQVPYSIRVQHVARLPRLFRVVTDFSSRLMPV